MVFTIPATKSHQQRRQRDPRRCNPRGFSTTLIAFLSKREARQLFSLKFTRPATGSFPSAYEGRTFRDIAWLPGAKLRHCVEQNRSITGRLVCSALICSPITTRS